MESIDCLIVGAGAVGLAIAREVAAHGLETIILEQHAAFGREISSRSSEVIHSGLYYPKDSLKAKLCVAGRELLYKYCQEHGVPSRQCGKLIVATTKDQISTLEHLHLSAQANAIFDTLLLDQSSVRTLEPELQCQAALFVPSTGIFDSHAFMSALLADAETHGAILSCRSFALCASRNSATWDVSIEGLDEFSLRTRWLVNSAGLGAIQFANSINNLAPIHVPKSYFAKGRYFSISGAAPFTHLVYPVPENGGLGIHLTLDLAGHARFGPDVLWTNSIDYDVAMDDVPRFKHAIRTYWPGIDRRRLQPSYAGIRPKISGPNERPADFRIDGPQSHGMDGLINLFGIESPGLTASLAIADLVRRLIVST